MPDLTHYTLPNGLTILLREAQVDGDGGKHESWAISLRMPEA